MNAGYDKEAYSSSSRKCIKRLVNCALVRIDAATQKVSTVASNKLSITMDFFYTIVEGLEAILELASKKTPDPNPYNPGSGCVVA